MSIKQRAKTAARRRVARASVAVPLTVGRRGFGPKRWQRLVARARIAEAFRLLRAEGNPVGALAQVEPFLADSSGADATLSSRAWALVAEAREKQGNRAGALTAARSAVAAEQESVDFTARLVHQRLATKAGDPDEAAEATAQLVDTRPRNLREVQAVLVALRTATHDEVTRLRANFAHWGLAEWDDHA